MVYITTVCLDFTHTGTPMMSGHTAVTGFLPELWRIFAIWL